MDQRRPVSAAELRRFGIVLAALLCVLAGFQAWRQHGTAAWIAGSAGALSAAVSALLPRILAPVHAAMVRIGVLLAWVNTRIVLVLVYYLLVTPIGLAMRLLGHDPLRLRPGARETYWIDKPADSRGIKRYEKMF